MELGSPGAALFFLGLHRIRIFGSLHRRDPGCHFPGLGAGQEHRQQGKQHGTKKIMGEVLMVVMPASSWVERKTTGTRTAPMP